MKIKGVKIKKIKNLSNAFPEVIQGLVLLFSQSYFHNYMDGDGNTIWLCMPNIYMGLPPEEQALVWTWGCGPGDGIGDILVPDTAYGLSLRPACGPHDLGYRRSPKRLAYKFCADFRFLINMILIAFQKTFVLKTSTPWLFGLRLLRIMKYFWAVFQGGNDAFFD